MLASNLRIGSQNSFFCISYTLLRYHNLWSHPKICHSSKMLKPYKSKTTERQIFWFFTFHCGPSSGKTEVLIARLLLSSCSVSFNATMFWLFFIWNGFLHFSLCSSKWVIALSSAALKLCSKIFLIFIVIIAINQQQWQKENSKVTKNVNNTSFIWNIFIIEKTKKHEKSVSIQPQIMLVVSGGFTIFFTFKFFFIANGKVS